MIWSHNQLQDDLAAHLRRIGDRVVWTNMQMGPHGSPRPDVYTIAKSYARFSPLTYEIKISTADFRRDVVSGKWQSYLSFSAGVFFAAPSGLVGKADIPPGCGLILRNDTGWRVAKAPTLRHIEQLPLEAWLKLMIDGIDRGIAGLPEPRRIDDWVLCKKIREKYGEKIGAALRNLLTAEARLDLERAMAEKLADELESVRLKSMERARNESAQEASELQAARNTLANALGLKADAPLWEIRHAAVETADRLSRDVEVSRLHRRLERIKNILAETDEPIPFAEPLLKGASA